MDYPSFSLRRSRRHPFGSWDGEGKAEMRCWIREIALCFPGLDVGHGPVNVVDAGSSSVRMDALA
jgi:hypothetical protein